MVTVVAPIAGPILGGWITDNYSWEWIFFINVPIGIFASLVVGSQLRGRPEKLDKPRWITSDWSRWSRRWGAAGHARPGQRSADWFNSTKIIVLAIVTAIALTVFLIWELPTRTPIVNLRLFRHRNFASGTLAMVLAYSAFFSRRPC
jgi:DHA2 family multidrug resistance protein